MSKVTVPSIKARKGGERIVAVTAYDYPTAVLADAAGIDVVLVGDSLGNTILGYESTIPVELEEMLAATRAVRRGIQRALLVGDMPFGSYHGDLAHAVAAAVRFLKAGAEAVKIEGGKRRAALVRKLVENEIPVMGHIGLTPQSVHAMGGYRVQGKSSEEAEALVDDALSLEAAGAFSIVLEGVPADLGGRIAGQVGIPTIGIGAGPDCDGQILVLADLLGLTVPSPSRLARTEETAPPAESLKPPKPRFVREYLDLRGSILGALSRYVEDVRRGSFPSEKESYLSPARVQAHRVGNDG